MASLSDELSEAVESAYRVACSFYAWASNEYEAACMAGDTTRRRWADDVLRHANGVQGSALRVKVASDAASQSAVPSFEDVLRHPWSQPDPDGEVLAAVARHVDPFTQRFQLCDDDGIVRKGAMHHGTDYPCTGHAHLGGEHILCTNSVHEVRLPSAT